jgi:hypothetical protein
MLVRKKFSFGLYIGRTGSSLKPALTCEELGLGPNQRL